MTRRRHQSRRAWVIIEELLQLVLRKNRGAARVLAEELFRRGVMLASDVDEVQS